jgi:hypothetical protein
MFPCLFAALLASKPVQVPKWVEFPAGEMPVENPLKGYAAFNDAAEHLSGYASMAFVYAPWRDLEPAAGEFRFDRLDELFEHPLAKGKPVVLRIYLDYPGRPTGVPQWLVDSGVKMTSYTDFGGGLSPDYNNPKLTSALARFIEALGKRYSENLRVPFLEVGFLGYWGEWHTYPRTELFANEQTQALVVGALHKAFPHTQMLGRNPSYASLKKPWIGFHDDLIPDDTDAGQDWNFLPSMTAHGLADNWKVAPTGGEMVPFAAKRLLSTDWDKLVSAVKKCHFSFIAGYCPVLERNVDAEFKRRSDDLTRLLGYCYRLQRAVLPDDALAKDWSYRIEGANIGVAPFYYPWEVHLALLKKDGSVATQTKAAVDLRTWLPGKFALQGTANWHVPTGIYDLAIGIIDPRTNRPAIAFANHLPVVNGWTVLKANLGLGSIRALKPW